MSAADNRLVAPLARQLQAIDGGWAPLLRAWAASAAGAALLREIDSRVAGGSVIYPAKVFRALALTPLSRVRVLILGQDPYHGAGQAEGLAFSVAAGQPLPPSLRNIVTELGRDLGLPAARSGSLQRWADQGVLLLNTVLTVEHGRPASHAKLGWQALTDKIMLAVAESAKPKVFMLWGGHARAKAPLIASTGGDHLLLQCNHPSPLSARRGADPFAGCGHFSRAAAFLRGADSNAPALDWRLDTAPASAL